MPGHIIVTPGPLLRITATCVGKQVYGLTITSHTRTQNLSFRPKYSEKIIIRTVPSKPPAAETQRLMRSMSTCGSQGRCTAIPFSKRARAHHRLVSVSPPGLPSVHIQLSPGLPTPPSRLGCDFSFSVRATRAASWLQGHPLSPMMDLKGLRVWRDSRLSILSEPFNLGQHIKQMLR